MYKFLGSGQRPRAWIIASGCARHMVAAILVTILFPAGAAFAQDEDAATVQWAPTHGVDRGWRLQADYLGAKEDNRPIDIVSVTASHVWSLPYGVQGSLGVGILNANGNRIEPDRPPVNSDATGVLFGGGIRFAPVRLGPVEPFVEGTVHFLYTAGHPFPAGGSSVNGFVRWGGGANLRLSDQLSIEAGYHGAHVSNGGGLVPYNPAWNGRGGFIGLNWRLRK